MYIDMKTTLLFLVVLTLTSNAAPQPTITVNGVTRLAPARQASRQPIAVSATGRTALAPSRSSTTRSFFAEWNRRFWDFGPQKPTVSGFSRTVVAGARGSAAQTPSRRTLSGGRALPGGSTYPSLATGVPEGTYLKPALNVSATVVGAGQYRSGLDLVRTRGRR